MYQIIKLVISKVIATLNRKLAGIKKSELNMIKNGLLASVAYFRNDYRNKIVSDGEFIGLTNLGNYVYKWGNANRAVIEGLKVI